MNAIVRVGRLRERVDIEDPTTVADSYGGQSVTWSATYSSVPASIVPVRGREEQQLGRERTVQTYLVTIHHGYTVTTRSRINWQGTILNIRSVENRDTRHRRLTLECESGTGN